MYSPERILITGAAGFIGSNVLLHLAAKYPHYHFVVLDKLERGSSEKNVEPLVGQANFEFVKGDICCADLVCYVLDSQKIDTVMHFAAETHVDNSFGNSMIFTQTNIQGTHTLLEAAKNARRPIKRFIHVSTDEVYGEGCLDSSEKQTEHSTVNPTNPYAATKAGAEFLVKSYHSSFGLPVIITRGNNVYGPRQYPDKLIPKFISLLARGRPLPIHGSGKNRRSFLHVADVAEAFDLILHKGTIGQVYNIGAEHEYENIEVAQQLIHIFRQQYPHLLEATKPDSEYITYVHDRVFNDLRYHICSNALKQLGWTAQQSAFPQGLISTVQWYLDHPDHWSKIDSALVAHPFEQKNSDQNCTNGQTTEMLTVRQAVQSNDILKQKALNIDNVESFVNSLNVQEIEQLLDLLDQRRTGNPQVELIGTRVQTHLDAISQAVQPKKLVWLIYGARGWIGQQVCTLLTVTDDNVVIQAEARADNPQQVEQELIRYKPDRVISLLGRTHGAGFSTIDYLEQTGKLIENVNDNLFAPLCLYSLCLKHNIHLTYLGTGCIFKYKVDDPTYQFNEQDEPNFFGSSYSVVKGITDRLMHCLPQTCLNVRIRMPITPDYHPRNFITKILNYDKICSIDNSMSVLPELLPIMLNMARDKQVGTVNLTNPGTISHNQVLQMYKDIVDPAFEWSNFSPEEQRKILLADRSNNHLSTARLTQYCPTVRPIQEAVRDVMHQMAQLKKASK